MQLITKVVTTDEEEEALNVINDINCDDIQCSKCPLLLDAYINNNISNRYKCVKLVVREYFNQKNKEN